MVCAKLITGIAKTFVGSPGVAALVTAGAWHLALIHISARDLVVCQSEASTTRATNTTKFDLTVVMAAAIIHRTRVHQLALSSIHTHTVPRATGADDPP